MFSIIYGSYGKNKDKNNVIKIEGGVLEVEEKGEKVGR
jgi:hypothetical protein